MNELLKQGEKAMYILIIQRNRFRDRFISSETEHRSEHATLDDAKRAAAAWGAVGDWTESKPGAAWYSVIPQDTLFALLAGAVASIYIPDSAAQ
jgi:hypothetical protein